MYFVSNTLSGIESLNHVCQWYSPHESMFSIRTQGLKWECGIHSNLLFKLDVSDSHIKRDSGGREKENKLPPLCCILFLEAFSSLQEMPRLLL